MKGYSMTLFFSYGPNIKLNGLSRQHYGHLFQERRHGKQEMKEDGQLNQPRSIALNLTKKLTAPND